MGLLSASDEGLFEGAAEGFAAEESEESGSLGECPEALGVGGAEPLEVYGEECGVEVFAIWGSGEGMGREVWGRGGELRGALGIGGAEPAIVGPEHFLDSGFASQGASAAVG